jgi:signal transduction histidine kinase
MRLFQFPQKKNYVLLGIIAVCATLLAILSYQYSVSYSDQILGIASEDIRSNAKIQADYLSLILSNGLKSITTNLQVLSNTRGVQNYDKDSVILFDAVQKSTNELPDSYMWLDQNGKLLWLSGGVNESSIHKQNGLDFSYAPYFTIPRDKHAAYYSNTMVESNNNNNNMAVKMYISYPILDKHNNANNNNTVGIFKGVVAAIIAFDLNSGILKKQSSAEVQKNLVILVDNNGTILSSYNNRLIGQNIFQYAFQISRTQTRTLNDFFRHSLSAYNADSIDMELDGKKSSIVAETIANNGKKLWTMYVIAPHDLTRTVDILFNQQNKFSALMIIIIGIIAFGIAWIVISWNKGLESIVNSRTFELKKANNYLMAINEQLKTHDKMQNEFINIASHEMKTPTQSILLHSSLLDAQPEIREESIEVIRRSATRLQRLTSDILDITRIESHTLKLNKERFNLKDVITPILEEYDTEIDSGKMQLIYEPKDIFVVADKSRITQVISNLLNNAIKFTREGSIHVTAEKKSNDDDNDGFVVISIIDTGTGIDPIILPKLFSKFATKSDMGIGLGLYISKNIVEAHGGTIWAENNKMNGVRKGATFSFSLYKQTN